MERGLAILSYSHRDEALHMKEKICCCKLQYTERRIFLMSYKHPTLTQGT